MHRTPRGVAMIAALVLTFLLSACASMDPNRPSPTPLDMAKVWSTNISTALVAASSAYVGPREAEVREMTGKLQQASTAFAAMGDVSTARSAVSVATDPPATSTAPTL